MMNFRTVLYNPLTQQSKPKNIKYLSLTPLQLDPTLKIPHQSYGWVRRRGHLMLHTMTPGIS